MISQKDIEEYVNKAANVLKDIADAADIKQYIFPMLFFKRISDIWDEEYENAVEIYGTDIDVSELNENFRFQIPSGSHWKDIRSISINIGEKIQRALREIENKNFQLLNGVFGEAQWTNKNTLSDKKLIDLIEHLSTVKLSLANISHDIMGRSFEFLVKEFAKETGHTAADFYTNRTVIDLVLEIVKPEPNESIYDPACGSGGFLVKTSSYLKKQGKEHRNIKLYGQELKVFTAAIARINLLMHGIDEFTLMQGNTIDDPKILENDELKTFDIIMSNPTFSFDKWNQSKFASDPFGRNILGTPPPSIGDYAFEQHIIKSLKKQTGRSVTVMPHGILFRDAEQSMRQKMVELDYVDAVIGLGKNLFFGSGMECCLLVCRSNKEQNRKGKILFIDAKDEVKLDRSDAYLLEHNISKISDVFNAFKETLGFSKIVSNDEVLGNKANLSIQLYVKQENNNEEHQMDELLELTRSNQVNLNSNIDKLFNQLKSLGIE
jgi:type I restriction enzyme M protein